MLKLTSRRLVVGSTHQYKKDDSSESSFFCTIKF